MCKMRWMCKYLTLACKRARRIAYPRVETQARGELEDGLGGTNRNKVPIRSYPTRGYNSAPAWLAVSTDAFEPWARSSRSMRHSSARPIPRRRCVSLTCMSAHQVAPRASTLRTRPTSSCPARATYWRKGASSPRRASGIGRERVARPSRAASSGVRTRSISTCEAGRGIRLSRCRKNPSVASSR